MAYIGNIGTLLKSIYVRDKLPTKKRSERKTKTSRRGKNISKFTYVTAVVSPTTAYVNSELTINDRLTSIRDRYREEIKIHGEQTKVKEGFVYLVSNKSYPGWIKAGMTIDFEDRLAQYNVYDPTDGFEMHNIKWTNNRRDSENFLLSAMENVATLRKGEWFCIDKEQAIKIFATV